MSQDNVNAQEPTGPSLDERIADLHRRSDEALTALGACVARISSLGGGIRLSTLLKTQAAFVTEQQTLRAAPPSVGLAMTMESALARIHAFVADMRPRETAAGPAASAASAAAADQTPAAAASGWTGWKKSAPADDDASATAPGAPAAPAEVGAQAGAETQAGGGTVAPRSLPASGPGVSALRQSLIRLMVALAPAPLRLQFEFGADFDVAGADPMTLAVRSHVVHRAVLPSLRRIQWDSAERCTLWFGDGPQRRMTQATFTPAGKIRIADEFRQNAGAQNAGGQQPAGQPAGRANPLQVGKDANRAAGEAGGWRWPTRAAVNAERARREQRAKGGGQRGDGQRHGQRPGGRPDGQRPGSQRPDPRRPQGPRPDAQRADRPRAEGQRADGARGEHAPRRDGQPGGGQRPPRPGGGAHPGAGRRPEGGRGEGAPRGPRADQPRREGGPRQGQGHGQPGGRPQGEHGGRGGEFRGGNRPDRGAGGRSDRPGGGRNPRDAGQRGPSFPRNSLMSDKLRAALSGARPGVDDKKDEDKS